MEFLIHIPVWLLWVVGITTGVILLFLAVFGVLFIVQLRTFDKVMHRHFGW